jgi:hypothetical protein
VARHRRGGAFYPGSLPLPHRPRHGTDHESKPLPSSSEICIHHTRFRRDKKTIEVTVRPRQGTKGICSGCDKPAPGYDRLPERRFEFIPFWGFLVCSRYCRRRLLCRACGVVAEKLSLERWQAPFHPSPHAIPGAGRANSLGRNPPRRSTPPGTGCVTRSSMSSAGAWTIARWSRSTPSAWIQIQYAKGHKYLTLVCTSLRLSTHQRDFFSRGSYPSRTNWRDSPARTSISPPNNSSASPICSSTI